jgi:hypothetical protein
VKFLKTIRDRSVFATIGKGAEMNAILAALFHRASASIYLCYVLWSTISVFYGIPSLVAARGTDWQVLFSIAVVITAAPACFGATFWPSFARMEAFAGTAFVGLMILYVILLVGNQINNVGSGSWSGVFLILSLMIMPACRCVIVLIFLVRQAAAREKAYLQYLQLRTQRGE